MLPRRLSRRSQSRCHQRQRREKRTATADNFAQPSQRRFSNFVSLAQHLAKKFSGLALQPLPEKGLTGRFAADFVETRRGDLERWLRRIARHPVVRYSDALVTFLGAEDEEVSHLSCCSDIELTATVFIGRSGRGCVRPWTRTRTWARSSTPSEFEARFQRGRLMKTDALIRLRSIFHPSFNFDLEDAQETIERFENHVVAADKGTQGLRETVAKLREGQKGARSGRCRAALYRRLMRTSTDMQTTATCAGSLLSTSSLSSDRGRSEEAPTPAQVDPNATSLSGWSRRASSPPTAAGVSWTIARVSLTLRPAKSRRRSAADERHPRLSASDEGDRVCRRATGRSRRPRGPACTSRPVASALSAQLSARR